MEKLLELLNEYDSGWSYDDYYGPFQYGQDSDAYHLCKYQLVSKEYGFIKWLVDNNKIDKRQVHILCGTDDMEYNYSERELVLMELAIQDTPINFLISLLK